MSAVAEGGGGVRTGSQLGGTKIAKGINNWVKGSPPTSMSNRAASLFYKTAKQGGLGAGGYATYKQGIPDPDKQGEGILSDLAIGGGISSGLGVAGTAIGAGVKAVVPKVDEALLPVVELAKKYNIPTSLDQVTNSKALNNLQKVSQELPFSGHDSFRSVQQDSFNRALIKTFGEDYDRFTPELMDKTFTKLGKQFDNFAKGKKYTVEALKNNLDEALEGADKIYSKEARDSVKLAIDDIANDFDGGILEGGKLSFHRAKVNAYARKANDFDRTALFRDLENALIETATEGDEALKAGFSKTKQHYKNLLAVEPLATKAKKGNISPTLLNQRVARVYGRQHTRGKAGDIGELARLGHELLGELGGSDTTQKLLYTGGAAGVAGAGQAPLVVGSLMGNKAFQKWFMQNPLVVEKALMKTYQKQIKAQGLENLGMTAQELIEEVK